MQKTLLTIIGLLVTGNLMSQGILDRYIDEGIKNNISLKQAALTFESSLESLNEAKGGMLPKIDFSSRYTKANGGRSFEFPVGDLMNPVYSSLNGIIGEEQFPEIDNLNLNFNRTTDIDTKLTLTQPLFDKRISYQKNIAEDQAKISQVDVSIQKRLLVSQIKKAYFNYLKSVKLVELFDSTSTLVEENLRVSEALYRNDKVTLDATFRAKTEVGKVNLQQAEAEKMQNNARAYFNFLLNRPLESAIQIENIIGDPTLPSALPQNTQNREEFAKINFGLKANESKRKLYESNNLPNIYAIANYGFQGSEYEFNNESDYTLASLVLSWNLFSGFQNKARKQQSIIQNQMLQSKEEELNNSIQLEAIQAFYDLKEKSQNYISTKKMVDEAKSTYMLINKKYQEGISSQLELIDARTNLTYTTIQNIISKYDIRISYAEYERVTAAYPVENL
ncbi:TolC family protein [Reichenbachiella sp. MALMAid0571]|uniref:TolC family protein n=1 Tax=Reichenbachiella sp. MALMAid0571 TaxID=3143939 RepID=UPI0032DE8883